MEKQERLESLGLNIRMERMRQKLSQEALAESAHVSRQTMSMIENGRQETSALHLIDIARGLNVSIDDLTKNI